MRKRLVTILALVMIAAIVTAAVVGCGSKSGGGGGGDPIATFNTAKGQLSSATSFSLQGQVGVKFNGTSGGTSLFPSNINIPFSGAMQKKGDVPDAKLSLDASFINDMLGGLMGGSTSMPSTMDIYIIDGKIYFQNPLDGSWYFADTTTIPGLPSSITSQDYSQLLDASTDVKVVSETSSVIKYQVGVDVNKLFTGDLSQLMSGLPEGQISEQELQDMINQMKQAFSNMKMNVTVDKASGNPTEISGSFDISLQGLGDLTGGLVDVGTSVTVSFDVNFADYGKQQNIKLPDAAKNALPAEDILSGSALSL